MKTIQFKSIVLPGRRIEVCNPELPEGGTVEVTVIVPDGIAPARRTILDYLDSLPVGPRSYPSWEEFEKGLQTEKDAWDR